MNVVITITQDAKFTISAYLCQGRMKVCKWGTDEEVRVFIPADLSYTGKARFDVKKIDKCIAPIVRALNEAGIYTVTSCCGHGKGDGNIHLYDGRELIIRGSPRCEKRSRARINSKHDTVSILTILLNRTDVSILI